MGSQVWVGQKKAVQVVYCTSQAVQHSTLCLPVLPAHHSFSRGSDFFFKLARAACKPACGFLSLLRLSFEPRFQGLSQLEGSAQRAQAGDVTELSHKCLSPAWLVSNPTWECQQCPLTSASSSHDPSPVTPQSAWDINDNDAGSGYCPPSVTSRRAHCDKSTDSNSQSVQQQA